MAMPSKVLVTGHTGFIGRALTDRLAHLPNVEWLGASSSMGVDLRVEDALRSVVRADAVVHLAGRTGALSSWDDPGQYFDVNYKMTLNVLEFARLHGSRVILLSSYLYGTPRYLPIDEDHPVQCANPYAASKYLAEELCRAYADLFKLDVTILRVFNVYGPGQGRDLLIPHVVAQAVHGDTISVQDLSPRRDYIWIDDVVSAIEMSLLRPSCGLSVFNIGFGCSYSVREIVDLVQQFTGARRVEERAVVRPNEIPDCVCDNRRFGQTFGWKPKTEISAGLQKMVEAARAH